MLLVLTYYDVRFLSLDPFLIGLTRLCFQDVASLQRTSQWLKQ